MAAPEIAFLYNHDAVHQVAHTAPVMAALAAMDGAARVTMITSSDAQEATAGSFLPPGASVTRLRFERGAATKAVERAAFGFAPARRAARLFDNRALLDRFDAIVVAETTSAMLRTRFGVRHPALIYLPHGAGDRSVGFRAVTSVFDLVLLAGAKVRDRMLREGIVTPDGSAIVGYPKFDSVPLDGRPRLFEDERPVVLYNPHFDPRLSSWWSEGGSVLDWAISQDRFDVVFAPHVMLFAKQVHASVEHRQWRRLRPLPARFLDRPQLLVDQGSERSIDMSYTLGADIYVGDASSQVYEFLVRPRPCIFLNPGRIAWRNDPSFAHWHLGQVIERAADLPAALDRAAALQPRFEPLQRAAFAATFSLTDEPSAHRAARAILDWLEQHPRGTR